MRIQTTNGRGNVIDDLIMDAIFIDVGKGIFISFQKDNSTYLSINYCNLNNINNIRHLIN